LIDTTEAAIYVHALEIELAWRLEVEFAEIKLMDRIFNPTSVAIIGASRDEKKWGFLVTKYLLEGGYKGRLHLVNPKCPEILGYKAVASVLDISERVDLALVMVSPRAVPTVVEECADKRVGGLVVFTSGFAETGEQGREREKQLVQSARRAGTRIIGPNCMGVFSSFCSMNATGMPSVPKGGIALISQSGNMGLSLFREASEKNVGLSKFISMGNQADIEFHDCLRFLRNDDSTKAIAMFIEGIKDGRAFLREARETVMRKPIVAMKVGRSQSGARSAASHTGSLAGDDIVHEGVFTQSGIVRVKEAGDLLDVAHVLATVQPPRGRRIAIVTDGGGHGSIACDAAESSGLVVPVFSAKTQDGLREILSAAPQILAANNPVDVGDIPFESPEVFSRCCSACLEDPETDMVLIAGLFGGYGSGQIVLSEETKRREEATAHEIVRLAKQFDKPVIVHTIYAKDPVLALQVLRDGGIPVYDLVEKAVRSLASLSLSGELKEKAVQERLEHSMRQRPSKVDAIFGRARAEGRAGLLETEARELVEQYEISVCAGDFAKTQNEAIEVARRIGYPVVMKVISPSILHKSDADCVKLNLRTDDEVALAYDGILRSARKFNEGADVRGVLVTSFVRGGTEIIVGVTRDLKFGPLVMFGLGGIFVELLKDVTFRSVPMSREDAVQMIEGIKGRPILDGGRGRPRCDHGAIVDVLMAVSRLADECPEIVELDLNPISVFEKGLMTLDARAKLR